MAVTVRDILERLKGIDRAEGQGADSREICAVLPFCPADGCAPEDTVCVTEDENAVLRVGAVYILCAGAANAAAPEDCRVIRCPGLKARTVLETVSGMLALDIRMSGAINDIYSATLRKKSFDDILDTAGRALGADIVLCGAKREVLSYYCPGVMGRQSTETFVGRGIVPVFDKKDCILSVSRRQMLSEHILINYVHNESGRLSNIICDISIGLSDVARIFIGVPGGGLPDGYIRLVQALCESVQAQMPWGANISMDREYGPFLLSLLDNGEMTRRAVEETAAHMSLSAEGLFRVLVVTHSQPGSPDIFFANFARDLETLFKNSRVSIYKGDLVALVCYDGADDAGHQENMRELERMLEKFVMQCGVSRCFDRLTMLNKNYVQAWEAGHTIYYPEISAPDMLTKELIPRVRQFEDCELMLLVDHVDRSGLNVKRCIHPIVDKLVDYDQEHGTSYVRTLHRYIKLSRRAQPTSDALFIHRNTLDYRLRKIQEITGINWEDGGLVARLYLSLAIVEYLYLKEHP